MVRTTEKMKQPQITKTKNTFASTLTLGFCIENEIYSVLTNVLFLASMLINSQYSLMCVLKKKSPAYFITIVKKLTAEQRYYYISAKVAYNSIKK
jgi:hypothetical protein